MFAIIGHRGFVGRNLERHIAHEGLSCCINAAGFKDVPECEKEPRKAFEANTFLPLSLINSYDVPFVHISSDHAYADVHTVYGMSKRAGDYLVAANDPKALIVVTGHIYDRDCPWVKWLHDELSHGRRVVAYPGIWNAPTYCGDLAKAIAKALRGGVHGKVTMLGPDYVTRAQLFKEYARANGFDEDLIVVGTEPAPWYYPRSYSGLPARFDYPFKSPYEGFLEMKK